MAGARISIDIVGLDTAQQQLNDFAAAGNDLTPVFRDIGDYLLRTTRDRFRSQTAPDGSDWAPLSEFYKQRKKRNRDKILTLYGNLSGTLAYQASARELLFGSPMIYGGVHQFGAAKGAFGQTGSGQPIPFGDIPAREFLGLSPADEVEVAELVGDYLEGQL